MSTLLLIMGFIVAGAGGIWLLLVIFTESVLWGLVALLFPIASLVFVFTNWEQSKTPFLVEMAGVAMLVASYALA